MIGIAGFRLTIRNVNFEEDGIIEVLKASFRLTIRNVNIEQNAVAVELFGGFRLTIRNVNIDVIEDWNLNFNVLD